MDALPLIAVHWLHVSFGVFWLGSILFGRGVLFPALRTLPESTESAVRDALVAGRSRQITTVVAIGTVTLGLIRGFLDGVFQRLLTPYGVTYLAAAVIGTAMVVWLLSPWLKTPLFSRLYVAGFGVMFTLMVAMRFGY